MVKRQEKLKLFSYSMVESFSTPPILLLFSPVAREEAELVVPLFLLCYLVSFQWQEKQGLLSVPDTF